MLRYLAKVTINPAIATGISDHIGSIEKGSSPTSCSGRSTPSVPSRRW
ncbi:amidohydrolase family protein [Streptomyces sp. M10(2022)]